MSTSLRPAAYVKRYGKSPQKARASRPALAGQVTAFVTPTPGSGPGGIAAGPDGNRNLRRTGRSHHASGNHHRIPVPSALGPWSLVVGPDGNLWFTVNAGDEKIGKMTLSGVPTLFPVPSYGAPLGLALGPDGNLWFTEYNIATITRMTPAGVVTRFLLPDTLSTPLSITAGPDGNLWFTAALQDRIGRLTP